MSKRDALPFATTLHVRDTCLCLHTQRAARAIARRFDEALRPAHLTSGQFSLLMSLNRPEPPRIGEVAALLATGPHDAHRESQAAGTARPGAGDGGRRRQARPPPSPRPRGRAALASALPLWQQTQTAIERLVGDADRLRADLHALS